MPAAGWFRDPLGGEDLRWWDGQAWTMTLQGPSATPPPVEPAAPATVITEERARPALAAVDGRGYGTDSKAPEVVVWRRPSWIAAAAALVLFAAGGSYVALRPDAPAAHTSRASSPPVSGPVTTLGTAECAALPAIAPATGVPKPVGVPTGPGRYVDPVGGFRLDVPPAWKAQPLADADGQRLVALTDPNVTRSVSVEVAASAAGVTSLDATRQVCGTLPAVEASTATFAAVPGDPGGYRGVAVGPQLAAITLTRTLGTRRVTVLLLGAKDAVLDQGGDAPALAVLASVADSPRQPAGDPAHPR